MPFPSLVYDSIGAVVAWECCFRRAQMREVLFIRSSRPQDRDKTLLTGKKKIREEKIGSSLNSQAQASESCNNALKSK